MALETQHLVNGVTVYWGRIRHQGIKLNKRLGTDKQAAERIYNRLKANPAALDKDKPSALIRMRPWLKMRLSKRTGRASQGERRQVEDYVMCQEWFMAKRVCDVAPHDIRKVIETIRETGKLAESTITNIHSVLSSCFQWAVFDNILATNPCRGLPKGILIRGRKKKRVPYTRTEARTVMECEAILKATRMWLYLAFYTGMREGEVCGRRFMDWKAEGTPLGALHVHDQYDGQPLKTEDDDDTENVQARWVPIHRELERMLMWWWEEGFEEVYARQPTPEDYIVPTAGGMRCHSRSSAYKAFRTALRRAGVGNKTLHSTRHTFISVARAGTTRADMVERITHNAKGTTLDGYTHAEWDVLCEIVSGVDYSIDKATTAGFIGGGPPQRKKLAAESAKPANVLDFEVGHSTVIEFEGRRLKVSEWEKETGIPRKTIASRLNLGWSVERALTTPIDCRKTRVASRVASDIKKSA